MFSRILTNKSTKKSLTQIDRLKRALEDAEAIVIGAGAGLSTSAGLTYSGERFEQDFGDFIKKYGIRDMYSGGFYPFETLEEYWAWWSRHIMVNRYERAPKPVYDDLLALVDGKDYFVLTTNVDHQFQLVGFDKKRLFYTQGDYGLFQCSKPCHQGTYDNEEIVRRMVSEQTDMKVPTDLIPRCPKCGRPMTMNLRCDDTFVQDEGWYAAATRYEDFLRRHEGQRVLFLECGRPMTMNLRCDDTFVQDEGWYAAATRYEDFLRRHEGQRVLFLELGVGMNTPVIIKYPFWKMTAHNPNAIYACINVGQAYAPNELIGQAIVIDNDIGSALEQFGVR